MRFLDAQIIRYSPHHSLFVLYGVNHSSFKL